MDIDEDTPRKASAGGSPNKGLFGDFMESAKSPQTVAKVRMMEIAWESGWRVRLHE